MEPTRVNQRTRGLAAIAKRFPRDCHDTLPWLISFSIDAQMSFKRRAVVLCVVFLALNGLSTLLGVWWFWPDGQQRIPNPTQFECWVFLILGQFFGFLSLIQYPLACLGSFPFRQLAFPYRMILSIFLTSVLSGLFYAWAVGLLLRICERLSNSLHPRVSRWRGSR